MFSAERASESAHVAEYGQTREISISVVRPSFPLSLQPPSLSTLPYANMNCSLWVDMKFLICRFVNMSTL